MRFIKVYLGAFVALVLLSTPAAAQQYPSQPITFIVPRTPGGGSDIIIRTLAPELSKKLGVLVLIENRPDSAAIIGAQLVAQSKPDGYHFYLSDNSFYQNPAINNALPYDTFKDFTAVTMLAEGPVLMVANPNVPAKNLKEVIELAKKDPEKYTFASGGIGSSTHLIGVLLNLEAGTRIRHIPYKSAGDSIAAVIGGHTSYQFGGISSARVHAESGKVVPIALTGSKRNPAMPNVPTMGETGLEAVDVTSVWGVHAPAGTPLAIRQKVRDAFAAVMADSEMTRKLNSLGYTPIGNTPEEHQAMTERIVNRWVALSKKVNLSD
ncbi:MAG: tripartite tricarboxylate transporter substrate binding protein [Gammaproteobacteria bacterium]